MTTTTSGAVGFAPVGTFVQDLAKEVGKSAATVAAYIKKHLPTALIKRKNSNNRQANFATEQAVEVVRAHYLAKATDNSSLLQELERLRAENERLRARVEELENENADLETRAISKDRKRRFTEEDFERWKQPDAFDEGLEVLREITEEYKRQIENNWRQANDERKQQKSKTRQLIKETREMLDRMDAEDAAERESRVVRFPTERTGRAKEEDS